MLGVGWGLLKVEISGVVVEFFEVGMENHQTVGRRGECVSCKASELYTINLVSQELGYSGHVPLFAIDQEISNAKHRCDFATLMLTLNSYPC
jgi:hypothetical protein